MDLTDFLGAQLGRADKVVWVGPVDDRLDLERLLPIVAVSEVDGSDDPGQSTADRDSVLVFSAGGAPDEAVGALAGGVLSGRPLHSRSIVVADAAPCDVGALAEALAGAGQDVVHVVRLDQSLGGSQGVGLSLETAGVDGIHELDRSALAQANLARLQASPLAQPATPSPHEFLIEARHALAAERRQRRLAEARAQKLEGELDVSRDEMRRWRASATVQLGRAVSNAVSDPRHAIPALPGRVLKVLAARRARRSAPEATSTTRRPADRAGLPVPGGRRRTFELALPDTAKVPVSPRRRADSPRSLHFEVPYPFFVPLRLEREGLAGYEPETLAWWLALCDAAPPGQVWDVGANTGLFASLAAAATDREVVAFEPTPDLAAWARDIAARNGLAYSVEQVAASDDDGTATFFLSDTTDSSSSLAKGFRKSTRHLEVVTERLDTYQARAGAVPAVLKIDTETTEPSVLRGADRMISAHRPWILCEVLANRGVEEPLSELLQKWSYRWYHLTEDLPPPSPDQIAGDPSYTYFMYLFAPEPLDEPLLERVRAWRTALADCLPI